MKYAAIAVVVVAFGLCAIMLAAGESEERLPPLGITQVHLNEEYTSPDGTWLFAFVPSGSTDRRVLVSINEHWVPGDRVDYVAGNVRVSDQFGSGVLVAAVLNSGGKFPKDTGLVVTIMQPRAKFGEARPLEQSLKLRKP